MGVNNIAYSGLNAAMTNMEAISNNIANSNTIGFKRSSLNFADVYAGSQSAAAQPGLGVQIKSISQDFSSAGKEFTSNGLDLSLNTSGFMIQKNASTGQMCYTRNGQIQLDNSGYLTGLSGRLQGYPAVSGKIVNNGSLVDLTIPNTPLAASATATSSLQLNLDAGSSVPATSTFSASDTTSYNFRTDTPIYDSLGNASTLSVFYINQTGNIWATQLFVDNVAIGSTGSIAFTSDGQLSSTTGLTGVSWAPGTGATTPQSLSMDFTGSTQFSNPNVVVNSTQDGYPSGTPTGFNIDSSGMINVMYSNGLSQVNGQVAVANFTAPQGLLKSDNMSWLATVESGNPNINQDNSIGAITAGSLELSNVDLTEELVNLMSAQHDFQANAQVQQTYNQIMQTIVKM